MSRSRDFYKQMTEGSQDNSSEMAIMSLGAATAKARQFLDAVPPASQAGRFAYVAPPGQGRSRGIPTPTLILYGIGGLAVVWMLCVFLLCLAGVGESCRVLSGLGWVVGGAFALALTPFSGIASAISAAGWAASAGRPCCEEKIKEAQDKANAAHAASMDAMQKRLDEASRTHAAGVSALKDELKAQTRTLAAMDSKLKTHGASLTGLADRHQASEAAVNERFADTVQRMSVQLESHASDEASRHRAALRDTLSAADVLAKRLGVVEKAHTSVTGFAERMGKVDGKIAASAKDFGERLGKVDGKIAASVKDLEDKYTGWMVGLSGAVTLACGGLVLFGATLTQVGKQSRSCLEGLESVRRAARTMTLDIIGAATRMDKVEREFQLLTASTGGRPTALSAATSCGNPTK